ncbi:MAG: DUF3445 domain-containing protein [Pirellulaceae bacterium]|nr:DUF3445 domain-containing protein [Pirellulaceae bacterium]
MRYFPLTTDHFEHQFGVRALDNPHSIVEATEHYQTEVAHKRNLLDTRKDYYFRALPKTEAAQREACDLLGDAASFLDCGTNTITGEIIEIDEQCPLYAIARHLQEDLAILSADADAGHPLVAGCVTFPSGWCIGDKLGHSILSVHRPVPEFDSALHKPTAMLMKRLKAGRPVWRMNWGVRASGQLDQSPIHADELAQLRTLITPANAGQNCYFRVERQTLARLSASGAVLFAIHTHQTPLGRLTAIQRSNLLGVLRTCPNETLAYKGILPMRDALIAYLSHPTV